MSFNIEWLPTAIDTYLEEINFIFLKWNYKEVQKFKLLVNENLVRLSKTPEIGSYSSEYELYSLVISLQTTLFYNFEQSTNIIELNLFWNNLKNPENLVTLLKNK